MVGKLKRSNSLQGWMELSSLEVERKNMTEQFDDFPNQTKQAIVMPVIRIES